MVLCGSAVALDRHHVTRRVARVPDAAQLVLLATAHPAIVSRPTVPQFRCHPRLPAASPTPHDQDFIADRRSHDIEDELRAGGASMQSGRRAITG